MNQEMKMIKCSIVRGGTSKGIFIMENELPSDKIQKDKIILSIFGSPDIRQIDGLGGADTLTSKLAIIGPSTIPNADVDYTFGQVSITDNFVDYGGNCGNISSAVGIFAIDNCLVKVTYPITKVRIHLTNTNKIITSEIEVENGKAKVNGDFHIDGVPGTGSKISIDWSNTIGGITGSMLPTDNVKDIICIDNNEYTVSIVDAGNIVIFINAKELGLVGTETPLEIDQNVTLTETIEKIRGKVCEKLSLVKDWRQAYKETPYQPFFAIVSASVNHKCFNGVYINKDEVDLVSRLSFMLKMHKAYPITGTVATGVAAKIKNSVVWDVLDDESKNKTILNISHPSGLLPIEVHAEYKDNKVIIKKLLVFRTARIIMDGYVYIKNNDIK